MRGQAFIAPAAVLVVCAGLCGGADLAARRAADAPLAERAETPAPRVPTPELDMAAPPASGASAVRGPAPQGPEHGTPVKKRSVSALTLILETPGELARMYGDCRNVGIWPLTVQRERSRRTAADLSASPEIRAKAKIDADSLDALLDREGEFGTIFQVCGVLGPAAPPPALR